MQKKRVLSPLFSRAKKGHILWGLIFLLALVSFYMPDAVNKGLILCLESIVPAVFPFVLISSLISIGGLGKSIGRMFHPFLRPIFKCTESAASAIALGFLCGYPIGASVAAEAYDKGEISGDELENILCFINNPSPSFVIGYVGSSLLGQRRMGIIIYLSVITSALLVGVALRVFRKKTYPSVSSSRSESSYPVSQLSSIITEAIVRSGGAMINICACIVTFFSLSSTICALLPDLPEIFKTFICGALEISSGVKAASELEKSAVSPIVCSAICAFSGISVHMQIFSACRGRNVRFIKFVISKAIQSVIAPILTYLIMHLPVSVDFPVMAYRPDLIRIIRASLFFFIITLTVIAIRSGSETKSRTK